MLLESLDERPGKVGILLNEGTEDDPGCVRIWQDDNKSTAPIKIWSDSLNAVQNSKKEWVSDKLRHIKTAYHFFKQYVKSGDIDLQHIAATAAKKVRKAAEAASLRKRKRTTEPVGKPNIYEVWDSSELRFSD